MSDDSPLVRRADVVLRADPRRVIAKLFLPGQELVATGISRAEALKVFGSPGIIPSGLERYLTPWAIAEAEQLFKERAGALALSPDAAMPITAR